MTSVTFVLDGEDWTVEGTENVVDAWLTAIPQLDYLKGECKKILINNKTHYDRERDYKRTKKQSETHQQIHCGKEPTNECPRCDSSLIIHVGDKRYCGGCFQAGVTSCKKLYEQIKDKMGEMNDGRENF